MWFRLSEEELPRKKHRRFGAGSGMTLEELEDYLEYRKSKEEKKDTHKHPHKSGADVVSMVIFLTVMSPFIGAAQVYALAYAYSNVLNLLAHLPKP